MDQIRRVAALRFAQQGFRRTSMSDIADDVGLAKSAIYKYYPCKRDILDAVMNDLLMAQIELGRHVILDHWGVRERISNLILKTRALIIGRVRESGLTNDAWQELRPLVHVHLMALQAEFSGVIVEILAQGSRNSEIYSEEPTLVARMLGLSVADMLHGIVDRRITDDDEEQIRRFRTLVTVVMNGMSPRS